ncbi:hypothetical protein RB195_020695 [Necator americanus]
MARVKNAGTEVTAKATMRRETDRRCKAVKLCSDEASTAFFLEIYTFSSLGGMSGRLEFPVHALGSVPISSFWNPECANFNNKNSRINKQ